VYLGVGPEQNFTYISALRPRIAFIVDIRRENMLEMLMYKTLFEMSATRAEFVSRLFSRRLTSIVDSQASVERVFAALGRRGDSQFFSENLRDIKDRLQKAHGFLLTPRDLRTISTSMPFEAVPRRSQIWDELQELMGYTDLRPQSELSRVGGHFRFVREMHQNLIVPIVGDFAAPARWNIQGSQRGSHAYVERGGVHLSRGEPAVAISPYGERWRTNRFHRGGGGSSLVPCLPSSSAAGV
jgi:hypothetical protein